MKHLIISLIAILLISRMAASQDLVLYDNFEGGLGLWQVSGWGLTTQYSVTPTHALTESPAGFYPNNATMLAATVTGADLTGWMGARLEFQARWEIETGFDFCFVEASRDGSFWVPLDALTGQHPDWQMLVYDLGGFAGLPNVRLRFRFVTDPQVNQDGLCVDDVGVWGLPEDQSGPLIIHRGPAAYQGGSGPRPVYAEIWDASGISQEQLFYRTDGTPFRTVPLDSLAGERYYHTIPAQEAGTAVEYYFRAVDAAPGGHEAFSDTFAYVAGQMLIQDDGLSEDIFEAPAGYRAAVRFARPNAGYLATALVRIYTDAFHPLDSLDLYVWADSSALPGPLLAGPFPFWPDCTPLNPEAWTPVDLRSALLTAPDTFHVGFEFGGSGATLMALPYDTPAAWGRSSADQGSGFAPIEFGDFHLRTVVGGLTPDTLFAPDDLTGAGDGDLVHLSWSAPGPGDDLLRYEIERQGAIVGQTGHLETTWTDNLAGLPEGDYQYRVRARYSTGVSLFCDPWSYHYVPVGVIGGGATPAMTGAAAFPNPTNGMIKLRLGPEFKGGKVAVRLFDVRGREVRSWVLTAAGAGAVGLDLPAQGLRAGVYVLDIRSEGLQQRLKVVMLP